MFSLQAVADIVRTTLGPRAMLKMLLDANGGIVLTNDGNAILREIDVSHPAAKSIIELSRTQDEEVRRCYKQCLQQPCDLLAGGGGSGSQHRPVTGRVVSEIKRLVRLSADA